MRSRYGLFVSAVGAGLLAVSVFLPWYGVRFTHAGLGAARHTGGGLLAQLGGPVAHAYSVLLHGHLAGLGAQDLTALSGHEALRDLSVILLILAGLALLDALFPLMRSGAASMAVPEGGGGSVVLLGSLAVACVVFRMCFPPQPGGALLVLSTREGAWLALLGALAMVAGGLWPRYSDMVGGEEGSLADPWSVLAGWGAPTP